MMTTNPKHNGVAPNRLVVGAHYGTRDWLLQRLSATLMALYLAVLAVMLAFGSGSGYFAWSTLFSLMWFKLFSVMVILSLCYHAWVGVRDIVMDYIKPAGWRIVLYVFIVTWLVATLGWGIHILWKV